MSQLSSLICPAPGRARAAAARLCSVCIPFLPGCGHWLGREWWSQLQGKRSQGRPQPLSGDIHITHYHLHMDFKLSLKYLKNLLKRTYWTENVNILFLHVDQLTANSSENTEFVWFTVLTSNLKCKMRNMWSPPKQRSPAVPVRDQCCKI